MKAFMKAYKGIFFNLCAIQPFYKYAGSTISNLHRLFASWFKSRKTTVTTRLFQLANRKNRAKKGLRHTRTENFSAPITETETESRTKTEISAETETEMSFGRSLPLNTKASDTMGKILETSFQVSRLLEHGVEHLQSLVYSAA